MFAYPPSMQTPREHQYQNSNVGMEPTDPKKAMPMAVEYPHVSDWLEGLTHNPSRNRDNIHYPGYADQLLENEIFRLDDLNRFTSKDHNIQSR